MIQDLIIFQKTYDFLLWLKPVTQKFAKAHKYGLGKDGFWQTKIPFSGK